jgi:hypothetical protein
MHASLKIKAEVQGFVLHVRVATRVVLLHIRSLLQTHRVELDTGIDIIYSRDHKEEREQDFPPISFHKAAKPP